MKIPPKFFKKNNIIYQESTVLQQAEAIKFGQILYVSEPVFKLLNGAENDKEFDLVVNNLKIKIPGSISPKGKELLSEMEKDLKERFGK